MYVVLCQIIFQIIHFQSPNFSSVLVNDLNEHLVVCHCS